MSAQDAHGIWRFAGRELHEASHELYVHGRPVALERKPFELLCLLLRRPGELVTRDELVESVWRGRVISDAALSRTVMKLRQALADSDQRIVATVHGYGYRLAVPVEAADDSGIPEDRVTKPLHPSVSFPRRRSGWAIVSALVLALVAMLAWNRLGTATSPRLALLPVEVKDSVDNRWVELGLMGYLATELGRDFEVLPERKAMAALGDDRAGAVERLRSAYGPLDVLETTLATAGDGLQLRYTLHRVQHAPLQGHINADSALAAADLLLQRLYQAFNTELERATNVPLARELYARGRAAMMAGDARRARDYLLAALREDPALDWARYKLALAQRQLGVLEAAQSTFEQLAEKPGVEPKLATGARQALAILHWRGGRLDRAQDEFAKALAIAERHGLSELIPGQLLNLGIVASSRGEYDQARELYLRALHLSRARGDRDTQARVHNSLGVLAWKNGAVDRSYTEHARALAIRRELAQPRDLAASLNNLATVALVRGEWDSARSLLDEAAALRQELGDGAGLASTKRNLAKLSLLRGDYARAETLMQESLALALDHGYASAEAAAFALGGEIAAQQGELETARERFAAAVERYRAIDQPFDALGVRLAAARLPGTAPETALALCEKVLADKQAPPPIKAQALTLRGSLRAEREPEAAADDWRQALAIADRLGQHELAVQAALDYAGMLLSQGRAREAEPLLARLSEWPEYAPALSLRARYWRARGNNERAEALLVRTENLSQ